MSQEFKKGDRVTWKSHGGNAEGRGAAQDHRGHRAGRPEAQKPSGAVSDSPWRYSLMNWGHDPTK